MSKHVDLPPGPTPLDDCQRFIVEVLWLKGLTVKQIAAYARVTIGQVQNAVQRGPYANRSAMTTAERQGQLDIQRQFRGGPAVRDMVDRGNLVESDFTAAPLQGGQIR